MPTRLLEVTQNSQLLDSILKLISSGAQEELPASAYDSRVLLLRYYSLRQKWIKFS